MFFEWLNENEMGRACGTCGGDEKCIKSLGGYSWEESDDFE